MYAGCVSGAIQKEEYLQIINDAGFTNIQLQKEKKITIPDEILYVYLNDAELGKVKNGDLGIMSITVYAEKPVENLEKLTEEKKSCCEPECCN